MDLETIRQIITSSDFDSKKALKEHWVKLMEKKEQIELLITNVEKTIEALEGRIVMGDKEKFEGFKKNIVEENERKYGMEIREKYGDNAVDKSNKKMLNMTEEEYAEFEKLSQEIFVTLEKAFATGNPAGELGEKLAKLHKKWLSYTWGEYNKDAHRGLAQMYVDDQRFTAYYDNKKPGMAKFLRDAIFAYTDKLEE